MMLMLRFDQAELITKLDRLPPSLRVIFAASCAERMLPAYFTASGLTGWGDPETLARILTRLWEDLSGIKMKKSEVQKNIKICMKLIPKDYHEPWYVEQASAEDAGAALFYSLTCRQSSKSQEAMWSAQRACSAIDQFVIDRENVDLKSPGAMSRTFDHPLMQAELARQRRDIDELLRITDEDVRQVAARFRDRAKAESKIFFGPHS